MTEWNASGYARVAGLQEAMAAEVLSLLKLKGDERVLDLGCGNGKVTAEIAARVSNGFVLGVDASAEMIAFACEHFGALTNLRFETCDIRRLTFRQEFDLVVSFNALHWIPDQQEALRAIRSAMKPNARAQLRLVPDSERKSLETVLEEHESPRAGRSTFRASMIPICTSRPSNTPRWPRTAACMSSIFGRKINPGTSSPGKHSRPSVP